MGIFGIEIFGFFIKHSVLAVRLFANIMGGHTVIAVILGFIAQAAHSGFAIWGLVTVGSIVGQVFIGCLELFVAFLQAYVFAFLATIFIAGAVHKH
jgi:F-type H+-transporting ATPase subunit a